jgi:protoporphyrinogen oxidase
MKKALIIGAGPAGLTAAYELLKKGKDVEVVVFEESDCFGGISRTVEYKGNRMDMGGHRFFSKIPEVNAWWDQMLPMQGAPSYDDTVLDREVPLQKNGPDPEKEDRVMLTRHRVSRILFDDKFYDYPVSLKMETLKNMGFITTMKVGFSYLASLVHKKPDDNLENFYINRFGRKLYSMFFEYYTENLWGRHPSEIDASWGAQRVKGLSITAILKDIFGKIFHKKNRKVETSLIEQFKYPKLGPGELWDVTAAEVEKLGGTIIKGAKVTRLHKDDQNVLTGITYEKDGAEHFWKTPSALH